MNYVRAILCLGLFGGLGIAVLADAFPGGDGGNGKTRALKGLVESLTDQFGTVQTGFGLMILGAVLAIIFLMLRHQEG